MIQVAQQTKISLGSQIVLTIVTNSSSHDRLFATLWDQIETFDATFSRFRVTSELSAFNRAAGTKTKTSPAFHDFLVATKQAGQDSNGIFNPFVLPVLQQIGYQNSWTTPGLNGDDHSSDAVATIDALETGEDWAQIPEHTAIDSGGIGKGYLLDQLLRNVEPDILGYCFSLGGDILAGGQSGEPGGWHIAIAHATHTELDVATVTVPQGQTLAVATSGVTKRRGTGPTGTWHHLIDPRTNRPADTTVLTASVVAASGITADLAASALVITDGKYTPAPADSLIQFASPLPMRLIGQRIRGLDS